MDEKARVEPPVPLCHAAAIGEGEGRGFRLGEGTEQVAVFVVRWQGELRGYVNSCPHVGTPLDWLPDRFFDRDRALLVCGTHGARFRPGDGVCIAGPCLGTRLTPAAISVTDGTIVLSQ